MRKFMYRTDHLCRHRRIGAEEEPAQHCGILPQRWRLTDRGGDRGSRGGGRCDSWGARGDTGLQLALQILRLHPRQLLRQGHGLGLLHHQGRQQAGTDRLFPALATFALAGGGDQAEFARLNRGIAGKDDAAIVALLDLAQLAVAGIQDADGQLLRHYHL